MSREVNSSLSCEVGVVQSMVMPVAGIMANYQVYNGMVTEEQLDKDILACMDMPAHSFLGYPMN